MDPVCFINNEFKPLSEINLHVSDLSIHRAYAIFDFMARYGDRIPWIDRYIERFFNSARLMQLEVPLSANEIEAVIKDLIGRNQSTKCGIKLLLTGGYSKDGYSPGKPNFMILISDLPKYKEEDYINGINLINCNYRRSIPVAKTIDYSVAISNFERMQKENAMDLLYVWNDQILETARCNFFIMKEGIFYTALENILPGITRRAVIEFLTPDYFVVETEIPITMLENAEGAFITSTTKGIMPVNRIDNQIMNDGKVHPLLAELTRRFNQYMS